jgi:hypothetical protein
MEVCKTCVFYKDFLFSRPVCTRISNVDVKTQKNVPLKLYEGYKICKGYFYEPLPSLVKIKDDQNSE